MNRLSDEEVQLWLRESRRTRITLVVSAGLIFIAFVAAFYLPNLFTYLLRFGPVVFLIVILEDWWAIRRQRRRSRHFNRY